MRLASRGLAATALVHEMTIPPPEKSISGILLFLHMQTHFSNVFDLCIKLSFEMNWSKFDCGFL